MVMKYPFFLLPLNPLWTISNSSVPGCRRKVTALLTLCPEECSSAQGTQEGFLQWCHPWPRSSCFPYGFQAKFLQVHNQFWARKQIKRKRKSKQFISHREAKISAVLFVFFCGYLTSGDRSIIQGVKSKEEVVLPCSCCLSSCCFPFSSSLPSLFPHNTIHLPLA